MVAKAQKQSEASEIWEQMCFTLAVSAMLGRKGGDLSVGNTACMSELAYRLVIPTFQIFFFFLRES